MTQFSDGGAISGKLTGSYPEARVQFLEAGQPRLPNCCAHCVWWRPHEGNAEGACRKRAPEPPPAHLFPITKANDLCREFSRYYTKEEWEAIRAVWATPPPPP